MTNTQGTPFGISGQGAADIAAGIERSIEEGSVADGTRLPAVRELAADLDVAPGTVAAAYRTLRSRGLVATSRRGTVVTAPQALARPAVPLPPGTTDLSDGNPDLSLFPALPVGEIDVAHVLYDDVEDDPRLLDVTGAALRADGVDATHLAVVGGAHDGVERVLAAHLRPGDKVAVEDPGYTETFDLLRAMGMELLPMTIDASGPTPEALDAALDQGARAVIVTPRAQNPTGAAIAEPRSEELGAILSERPVLVIEDDHAGPVAGAPMHPITTGLERWAVIRSVSKYLGPDLRTAVVAGDMQTVRRLRARQALGTGWVSRILQRLAAHLLESDASRQALEVAEDTYRTRRDAMRAALEERGIESIGSTGFNMWVPVVEETPTVRHVLEAGFALRAGERFRLQSGPAVRITTSRLREEDAAPLADALAEMLAPSIRRTV